MLNAEYTDRVEFKVMVPFSETDSLKAEITEGTNGRAGIEEGEPVYYGVVEKEVVVFD